MPSLRKRLKQWMRIRGLALRRSIADALPLPLRNMLTPIVHFIDMLVLDHLFIRLVFPNRHKISKRAWRSAQPLSHQLLAAKTLGIRTVINLRGYANATTYRYEQQACRQLGLNFVDYQLRSRDVPSKQELIGLNHLFKNVEYPILLHCKSGADRAGLASAIYLHLMEGIPLETARNQLSLRFGHIRYADTGLLDAFLEEYIASKKHHLVDFLTWVERYYDPRALKTRFKSKSWANRFVYGILKRE